MSWRCLEDVFARRLEDVLKTFWRHLGMLSWRRLENVLKTSWRCLEDVFARRLEDVLKMSWRHLGKTSWRRLLKTKTKDVFIKANVCWVKAFCSFGSFTFFVIHVGNNNFIKKDPSVFEKYLGLAHRLNISRKATLEILWLFCPHK